MPSTVISQTEMAPVSTARPRRRGGDLSLRPLFTNTQTDNEADLGPIVPLPEIERREILRAMRYTKGDRTAAAVLLRNGRTTLYRRLKDTASAMSLSRPAAPGNT